MTNVQHDYNEKINQFLLAKKASGTPKEKIPIYLNMLKFFTEHLAKKGLTVEGIENPVAEVFGITFDGLGEEKVGDLRNLFLDFVHFCKGHLKVEKKDGKLSIEVAPAEVLKDQKDNPQEKQAKDNSQAKPLQDTISCPKCGEAQDKTAQSCSECGFILRAPAKLSRLITTEKPKGRRVYILGIIGCIILIFAISRMISGPSSNLKIIGTDITVSTNISIDNFELGQYASEMKGYVEGLGEVINTWGKLKLTENSWKPEYEMAYANLKQLQKKINKTTPPEQIQDYHKRMEILNDQLVQELKGIKQYFGPQSGTLSDGQRQGRMFNSVNILIKDISAEKGFYVELIKGVCLYNKVKECF